MQLIHSIRARAWHYQPQHFPIGQVTGFMHISCRLPCADQPSGVSFDEGSWLVYNLMASILFVRPFNIIQLSLGLSSLVACYSDILDMHLPRLTIFFTYLIALASASPIAWPDDKLEEINALRAKGISEVSRLLKAFSSFQVLSSFTCCLQTATQTFEPFQNA